LSAIDATHDAKLRSWVASANDPQTDFPIQNLPLGVFRRRGDTGSRRIGVAIGDQVLDLAACANGGLLTGAAGAVGRFAIDDSLNRLVAQGRDALTALRRTLSEILQERNAKASARASTLLLPMADVDLFCPMDVGDYSDFYASIHHATNVGSMFRPQNPLLPNYKYVPIGYHGRASSIVVSGTPVQRPSGQTRDGDEGPPTFGPTKRLDYELEVGAFIGRGNARGDPIPLEHAEDHLCGVCIVNDWSARDVQTWEYLPLGPFLSKSFATSMSPWLVTLDALAPFRIPAMKRPSGDPAPLPYLADRGNQEQGGIALTLEVWLTSAAMRDRGDAPMLVSRGSFADMYWTFGQILTHHTSNGCNMRPGDLLASGTVSGNTKESRGCLLERTWRGSEPLQLPGGERRTFLEDDDEVTMRAYAERNGYRRIGFGECVGRITSPSRRG
jgi:fumarylacetoacetase